MDGTIPCVEASSSPALIDRALVLKWIVGHSETIEAAPGWRNHSQVVNYPHCTHSSGWGVEKFSF